MLCTSFVAHCSLKNVTLLVFIILTVGLHIYLPTSLLKLNDRIIGNNTFVGGRSSSGSEGADDYLTRGYLYDDSDGDPISRSQIPIKFYTKEDVVNCFDLMSSSAGRGNHRPMHFAFLGDSTVRQHFVSFLRWIPDYDRRTTANKSALFTDFHFIDDRHITSALLNNLRVSYHWRRHIREKLIDDFKIWTSASKEGNQTSPDFILLGITAHHMNINNVSNSLETYVSLLEHKLIPVIKKSLAAHPEQKIVWLRQSPIIEQVKPDFHNVTNQRIAKYNQEIRRVFSGTGVVIWDSINSIVEEHTRACGLTSFSREDRKIFANCQDYIHPGFGAIFFGSQMIFNHLCEADDVD